MSVPRLATIGLLLLIASTLGFTCQIGAGNTTPSVKSVTLARAVQQRRGNLQPIDAGDTFSSIDTVHAVIVVSNTLLKPKLRVVWTAVTTADPQFQNRVLRDDSEVLSEVSSQVDAYVTHDMPWPVGRYSVDVYLDGKLSRELSYSITS